MRGILAGVVFVAVVVVSLILVCRQPQEFSLPIVDKRQEIEEFDVEQGFSSIGATVRFPIVDG